MMFNLVFESNPSAPPVRATRVRGVGRVPEAVGGEDAIVYWRRV